MQKITRLQILIPIFTILIIQSCKENQENITPPPNEPAEFIPDNKTITIRYDGQIIFEGTIWNDEGTYYVDHKTDQATQEINQVYSWTSNSNNPVTIKGIIYGSPGSFPCEVDRRRSGRIIVRHSAGRSLSQLNHAVYDREKDWVLSVDFPAYTRIIPIHSDSLQKCFEITTTGNQVGIRFRPGYYQKHRGLSFFEPWTYKVWDRSVAGWCSWFAYFKEIDEEKIRKVADVLNEQLVPFGLEYLQIDDGYQQEPAGLPETWNIPNDKFPSGLDDLSNYISGKGLKPGIWTYTSFHQDKFAEENPDLFVTDDEKNPVYGRWVGYSVDGSNPDAIDKIIRPIYQGFKNMGWKYFKVDALRHLRYEGYNSHADYFNNKNTSLVEAYRNVVLSIRKEIGPDNFMLGCWGIRPELIGIIDGCRIGGDGYGYAGLAQFNSFNNVIWRNDPDHIELSEKEAYRSCMVTSLTGSLFMLTDKPEVYLTDRIEPAKRCIPVLFTVPGQIYDVDPSRSMYIDRVDSEVSGDGQRIFDGGMESPYNLFLLEIKKPYEYWIVLGRTEDNEKDIAFVDMGLNPLDDYHIFEFWSKTYLGAFSKRFEPGSINPKYNCQLFCIRKKQDHPQLLASNRHISCGGLEITDLYWEGNRLGGISKLVGHDPYELYIYEPERYSLQKYAFEGAELTGTLKTGHIRVFKLLSDSSGPLEWKITYIVR